MLTYWVKLISASILMKTECFSKEQKQKLMTSMLYHMTNVAWQESINLEESLMQNIDTVINALEP